MREFRKELWLLVVLEVDVRSGQVEVQACEGGSGANLGRKVVCWVPLESAEGGELTRLPCDCWGVV